MLVRHALFLSTIAALGCSTGLAAPSSELDPAQLLVQEITVALETKEVARYIPVETLSILRALKQRNGGPCGVLFQCIVNSSELSHFVTGRERAGHVWSALIDLAFSKLALEESDEQEEQTQRAVYREHAKHIVKEVVIPEHPLLSQSLQDAEYSGDFEKSLNNFLDSGMFYFEKFMSDAVVKFFGKKLHSILAHPQDPEYNAQRELRKLLHTYKQWTHRADLPGKYACVFLMTVTIKDIRESLDAANLSKHPLCSDVTKLASNVHTHMRRASPEKAGVAEEALKNVLSSRYPDPAEEEEQDGNEEVARMVVDEQEYESVMRGYSKKHGLVYGEKGDDELKQIDPEELNGFIAEALEAPLTARHLSLECLAIMRAYQEDVDVCRACLDNARQGLSLEKIQGQKKDHHFWERLIDTAFRVFAERHMEQARTILENVVIRSLPLFSQNDGFDLGSRIADFLTNTKSLYYFCANIAKELFEQRMIETFMTPDHQLYHNPNEFYAFLNLYQMTMFYHGDSYYKYAYRSLVEIGFENIVPLFLEQGTIEIDGGLRDFADSVYCEMEAKSPTLVHDALRRVWPEIYDRLAGERNGYHFFVNGYSDVDKQLQDGVQLREENISVEECKQLIRDAFGSHYFTMDRFDISFLILRGIIEDTQPFLVFFEFMFQKYIQERSIITRNNTDFWNSLVDHGFVQFTQSDKKVAREIVEKAIIRDHPFSNELRPLFEMEAFLEKKGYEKATFISIIVEQVAKDKFFQILDSETTTLAQEDEFYELIKKYTKTFRTTSYRLKCASEFLKNFPIEELKRIFQATKTTEDHNLNFHAIDLAEKVYQQVSLVSPEKAQSALENVSPHIYHQGPLNTYQDVVQAYEGAWIKKLDSEKFRDSVRMALDDEKTLTGLYPVYLAILRAFRDASPPCQQFSEYICDNYSYKRYGDMTSNHGKKWSELIDEYLYTFIKAKAQMYRENAQAMIQEVAKSAYPFSSEAPYRWDIDELCVVRRNSLQRYISCRVIPVFMEKWEKARKLNKTNAGRAREEVARLIAEYTQGPLEPTGESYYASAFLLKFPSWQIEEFVISGIVNRTKCNSVETFSEQAYLELHRMSAEASEHLRSVLPDVYEGVTDKSYANVMRAYSLSGIEPE